MLIRFAVTVKLICAFVFAYAYCWFSHEAAHIYFLSRLLQLEKSPTLGSLETSDYTVSLFLPVWGLNSNTCTLPSDDVKCFENKERFNISMAVIL